MPVNDAKYIKEVWAENLEEEMAYLRDLVEEYPYLAMVREKKKRDELVFESKYSSVFLKLRILNFLV
jgi:hypothetical protein